MELFDIIYYITITILFMSGLILWCIKNKDLHLLANSYLLIGIYGIIKLIIDFSKYPYFRLFSLILLFLGILLMSRFYSTLFMKNSTKYDYFSTINTFSIITGILLLIITYFLHSDEIFTFHHSIILILVMNYIPIMVLSLIKSLIILKYNIKKNFFSLSEQSIYLGLLLLLIGVLLQMEGDFTVGNIFISLGSILSTVGYYKNPNFIPFILNEKKRIQTKKLHEIEAKFIINMSDDIVVRANRENTIVFANPAISIFNLKQIDVLEKNFLNFIDPMFRTEYLMYFHNIWISLESSKFDLPINLGKDQIFLMSITATPIFLKNDIDSILLILRDITFQKEFEEKLESLVKEKTNLLKLKMSELKKEKKVRNNREKELRNSLQSLEQAREEKINFLANMSHEMRTPLNAIIGFSQIVQLELMEENADKKVQILSDILESSNHLLDLVNDMLNINDIGSFEEQLNLESFNILDLLEELKTMFLQQCSIKSLKFQVNTPDDNISIFSDKKKMKQIIINLIGNAIKFTDKGSVTVNLNVSDETLVIQVEDTGIGMEEKYLEKIFHPFVQLNKKTKGQIGTGLGLYYSKKMVELLKGSISVTCQIDIGTIFTLKFPLDYSLEG